MKSPPHCEASDKAEKPQTFEEQEEDQDCTGMQMCHWHHRNTVSSYYGVSKKRRKEGRQN